METRIVKSVIEIPAADWNAIVGPNRLICRHEFLSAVEQAGINDCRYFYPVVYDDGGIVAHASVYAISTELDLFARGAVKLCINGVRKAWRRFMILRSLECGTPVALGNTISFRDGHASAPALREIVLAVERIARERSIQVLLFRDFAEEEVAFYDVLTGMGYMRIHNLPGTRMEIRWRTFDGYLAEMRSQYRCKILAQRRKLAEGGVELDVLHNFSSLEDHLLELWRNAYERAREYKREMLTPEFFRNINNTLGDRSMVIVARKNGRIIGSLLLLVDDSTMIVLFSGMDYSDSRAYGVYFNMFYKAIELGIEMGLRDIDLGITTLAPKMDLGAKVVPLYMYMRHLNPFLSNAVPKMFDAMTPQPSILERNVFKR